MEDTRRVAIIIEVMIALDESMMKCIDDTFVGVGSVR